MKHFGFTADNVAHEIEIFLALLEGYYGRRPLIYTTAEFHDAYLIGQFPSGTASFFT